MLYCGPLGFPGSFNSLSLWGRTRPWLVWYRQSVFVLLLVKVRVVVAFFDDDFGCVGNNGCPLLFTQGLSNLCPILF